ncbi:MAG: hypothetical protein IJX65_07705 [Alistipes sp.]|nr:hypothetical protein [Alistipes sp.]
MVADLNIELTDVQKRALFKLAVDLVKADKQIHKDEVSLLDRLQRACGIGVSDLEFIHYISLQQAISCLSTLSEQSKQQALEVLSSIVGADSDIDSRESMLLTAIRLALEEQSQGWCTVVSTSDIDAECSAEQIIYLEREQCSGVHSVLSDKYDYLLLTKALNDVGLQLFYLPNVVAELERRWDDSEGAEGDFDFLRRSMEFIVPVGDRVRLSDLNNTLGGLDTKTFYKIVCSRYNIEPNRIPYQGFLMVKIEDNYLLEDDGRLVKMVDFLCIDISEQVKQRILHFVRLLEQNVNLISYEGYYRILYDYLSSEAKIASSLLIDRKGELRLVDIDNMALRFESAPQAKSLYLLLMFYGKVGVPQSCFEQALGYLNNAEILESINSDIFSLERLKQTLLAYRSDWAYLIYNLIVIYDYFSTKDSAKSSFLGYISKIIQHRSALKNYVNTGFSSVHRLAGADQYCIKYDKQSKSYSVEYSSTALAIQSADGVTHPATSHDLWCKLKK